MKKFYSARPLKNPEQKRKNLLFIRGGKSSMHYRLYPLPENRDWDLLFTTYDAPSQIDLKYADYLFQGGASKWQDLGFFIENYEPKYEYIWCLDDDITFQNKNDITHAFKEAEIHQLDICQPSLTHSSSFSWKITLQCPFFVMRMTNFVECMAPILSNNAIKKLYQDISLAVSGCGLDLIFWEALGKPKDKMAILDSIAINHVKPIDTNNGLFYQHLKNIGVDPREEVNFFLNKYHMEGLNFKVFHAVCVNEGHRLIVTKKEDTKSSMR